jgi:hypothetical protein
MSPSRLGTARGRAGACARDLPGGGVHGRMRTGSPRPAARALRGCAARCRSADRHAAPRQVGVLEEERVLASGAKAQGVQPRQRVPRHAGPLLLFRRCVLAHRGPCSAVQVAAHAAQRAPGVLTEQVAFSCCNLAGVYTLFAALYLVCFQIEAPPGPFLVASGLADAAFIAGSCRCLAATSLAPPTRPPAELCTAAFASPTLL